MKKTLLVLALLLLTGCSSNYEIVTCEDDEGIVVDRQFQPATGDGSRYGFVDEWTYVYHTSSGFYFESREFFDVGDLITNSYPCKQFKP